MKSDQVRVTVSVDEAAGPGHQGIQHRFDIASGELTEPGGSHDEHMSGASSHTGELGIAVDLKVHLPADSPPDTSGIGVQHRNVICAQRHLSRPLTRQAVSIYRRDNTHILSERGTGLTLHLVNASLPPRPDQASPARPSVERIRDAALKHFAAHGTAATSLRDIADTAGVSIGLVQHHFGTKDGLITAVDEHVLTVLGSNLAGTSPAPSPDPVVDHGHRVTTLIAEHTDVIDYLMRALLEDTPTGKLIFDTLVTMGEDRWNQHHENRLTAPDLDRTWAALNPLVLVLGAMALRTHLNRHLPEPFTTPTQLSRWESSVNTLIQRGQLSTPPPSRDP